MKKRLLSVLLCLCMLMTLLPTTALAAGSATADFTSGDGSAALALLNAAKTDGAADSTWEDNTLTLKGVNFTTSAATAVKLPNGATIVLEDGTTNTIKSIYSGSGPSYGIHVDQGGLTISGTGTLNVTGGSASGGSYGISAYNVTISGGTVVAQSGASNGDSFGISATQLDTGSVTISGTAKVTAIGGTARSSYGIMANGSVSISGGTVNATGGTEDSTSSDINGIRVNRNPITISGGTLIAEAKSRDTSVRALNKAPTISGAYQWRTSASGTWETGPADTSVFSGGYLALKPDNSTTPTTSLVFTHAYDVQRDPAFPKKGESIEISGLKDPKVPVGTQIIGNWTLSKKGLYGSDESIGENNENLKFIVDCIVGKYSELGLNSDAVVIHELKNGETRIAYGVLVAYDAANGNAVFLGDSRSSLSSGAGYLLTRAEKTDSVYNMTAFAQNERSIALDQTGTYPFPAATVGYSAQTAAQAAKKVTVTNIGNAATGALTVTLSGGDASSFTLNSGSISDIAFGDRNSFTVKPVTGLNAGTYTETVTVSGENIDSQSFTVSFTVNDAPPTPTHTVTWKSQDGTATLETDENVSNGTTPSFNGTIPSKDADAQYTYTFAGWATSRNQESGIELPAVTDDVTYYAAFSKTPREYQVTLKIDETTTDDTLTSYTYGTSATLPVPEKTGYSFGGWYASQDFTGDPVTAISRTDTGDKTFYAKWTEILEFTHAYDVQRSPAYPAMGETIRMRSPRAPIVPTGMADTGNWKLFEKGPYNSDASIVENNPNLKSIVDGIVARYRELGLPQNAGNIVIHELKNGVDEHIAYGVVVAYDAANGNAVFLGDTLFGGAGYLLSTGEKSGTIMVNVANSDTHTVTFDANGGSCDTITRPTDANGKLTSLPTATRSGYRFLGWYTADGKQVTTETVFTENTRVTAQWKRNSSSSPSSSSSSKTYPVDVADKSPDGGKINANLKNAQKGKTVTITVTPDAGKKLDTLTIRDENGKKITFTALGNDKYSFVMPASEVEITATFSEIAQKDGTIVLTIGSPDATVFGEQVTNDVAPIARNNRTLLPIRFVAEAMGATVDWNADLQKATVKQNDLLIEIYLGSTTAYVNGNPVVLDVEAFAENNRTYLPLRFIAESLGAEVLWEQATQSITVIPA